MSVSRQEMPLSQPGKLSFADHVSAWLGVVFAILTVGRFVLEPRFPLHPNVSLDLEFSHDTVRSYIVLVGTFLAAFGLQPVAQSIVGRLKAKWSPARTVLAISALCVFLAVFIVHFGRHQFGGWDYGIMIQTGWREVLGQVAYTDFIVPTPPGFNLPIKFAFQLFGVSWDANLYLASFFACTTFLWLYWLFRRLSLSGFAAAACSFSIESAAMLTLCFWWYNNTCLIMAAVFLLTCLVLAKYPDSVAASASYTVSLAVLATMKPNIAAVAIAGGVLILFIVSTRKTRLALLTLAAVLIVIAVFALNHISVTDMLANYRSVAKERGGTSKFGYLQLGAFEQKAAKRYVVALALPLLALFPIWFHKLRARDWRAFGLTLIFPLACLITYYGLRTNGEIRDVECTVLIASCAVVTFGMLPSHRLAGRYLSALLFASIACNL